MNAKMKLQPCLSSLVLFNHLFNHILPIHLGKEVVLLLCRGLKALLDIGDIVGAEGGIRRTDKGELSVVASSVQVLVFFLAGCVQACSAKRCLQLMYPSVSSPNRNHPPHNSHARLKNDVEFQLWSKSEQRARQYYQWPKVSARVKPRVQCSVEATSPARVPTLASRKPHSSF
jgi:hypothetical protein